MLRNVDYLRLLNVISIYNFIWPMDFFKNISGEIARTLDSNQVEGDKDEEGDKDVDKLQHVEQSKQEDLEEVNLKVYNNSTVLWEEEHGKSAVLPYNKNWTLGVFCAIKNHVLIFYYVLFSYIV